MSTEKSVMEILNEAADLVEDNWIAGLFAANSFGVSVEPTDPTAVKFCAVGSVMKAAHSVNRSEPKVALALKVLSKELKDAGKLIAYVNSIEEWNDTLCGSGTELAGLLRSAAQRSEEEHTK